MAVPVGGVLVVAGVVLVVVPWPPACDRTSRAGMSFMPHCGQRSAVSLVTSGCIGQAKPVGAASAMSFMPQLGQRPGSSLTTSGCIGHA